MLRKINARFAETALDDEIVLMNIDNGKFYALKGTSLAIWQRIDGTRGTAEIANELTAEYDVDPDTCAAEVARFLEAMTGAGFVEQG